MTKNINGKIYYDSDEFRIKISESIMKHSKDLENIRDYIAFDKNNIIYSSCLQI